MTYRPEVGETVLIERIRDDDSFKARITAVNEDGDVVQFERLDGATESNNLCSISDIQWTDDKSKLADVRLLQQQLEEDAWAELPFDPEF